MSTPALVGIWTPTNNQCWRFTSWWTKYKFSPAFFTSNLRKDFCDWWEGFCPQGQSLTSSRRLPNLNKNLSFSFFVFRESFCILLHHWGSPNHKTQTNQVAAIFEWECWNIESIEDLLDVIHKEYPLLKEFSSILFVRVYLFCYIPYLPCRLVEHDLVDLNCHRVDKPWHEDIVLGVPFSDLPSLESLYYRGCIHHFLCHIFRFKSIALDVILACQFMYGNEWILDMIMAVWGNDFLDGNKTKMEDEEWVY